MIEYVCRSVKGAARGNNEDSAFAKVYRVKDGEVFVAAVCDGMGGSDKGELASNHIVTRLEGWFDENYERYIVPDRLADSLSEPIRALIRNINNEINRICERIGGNAGSTLTLLVLAYGSYFVVQCGDSRAYKLTGSSAARITVDHSKVMNRVLSGEITPQQAVTAKEKNVITRCIGMGQAFEVDIYSGAAKDDEMFVLCSDGFHGGLDDENFYKLLDDSRGMDVMADNAISRKVACGERDDISVAAVKMKSAPVLHTYRQAVEQTTLPIEAIAPVDNNYTPEDGRIFSGSCVLEEPQPISKPASRNSSFNKKNIVVAFIAFAATIALCFAVIIGFNLLKNPGNFISGSNSGKGNSKSQPYVISDAIIVVEGDGIYEDTDSVKEEADTSAAAASQETAAAEITVTSAPVTSAAASAPAVTAAATTTTATTAASATTTTSSPAVTSAATTTTASAVTVTTTTTSAPAVTAATTTSRTPAVTVTTRITSATPPITVITTTTTTTEAAETTTTTTPEASTTEATSGITISPPASEETPTTTTTPETPATPAPSAESNPPESPEASADPPPSVPPANPDSSVSEE